MPGVWAVVVAAGRGERFGEPSRPPKQFAELDGVRVVDRAVLTAQSVCDGVVVVLAEGVAWDGPAVDAAVTGGATRSASVRAGLDVVPDDCDVVLVHDAARPLASRAVFERVIDAVRAGADAAVPAIPVADTVKEVERGRVVSTLPRDRLVVVQTPQAFRTVVLRAAHADGPDATDDAALVEAAGGAVAVVEGDPRNLKITTPADLTVASALLQSTAGTMKEGS